MISCRYLAQHLQQRSLHTFCRDSLTVVATFCRNLARGSLDLARRSEDRHAECCLQRSSRDAEKEIFRDRSQEILSAEFATSVLHREGHFAGVKRSSAQIYCGVLLLPKSITKFGWLHRPTTYAYCLFFVPGMHVNCKGWGHLRRIGKG